MRVSKIKAINDFTIVKLRPKSMVKNIYLFYIYVSTIAVLLN